MKIKLLPITLLFFICYGIQAQTINPFAPNKLNRNDLEKRLGAKSINTILFRPGKEIDSSWDTVNNVWVFQDSIRETFTSWGKSLLYLEYNGGSPYPTKTMSYYNSAGNVTSDTTMNWNGIAYNYQSEDVYMYDANSNMTQLMSKNWNGTSWDNFGRITYTWTNNQMTEFLYEFGYLTAWMNNVKLDYTYTGTQCTGFTQSNWTGANWQLFYKGINLVWNRITPNNGLESDPLSDIQQVPNGPGWKDSIKDNWTWDNFNNPTEIREQSLQGTSYVTIDDQKDFYQYDANNNMTEDINQKWSPAIHAARNYQKKEYSEYQTYIGINEIHADNNILLYPNPNSGSFKIAINRNNKAIGIKELKVFDIMGKAVWQTGASANNLFDVDISDYAQGIYYVRSINALGEIETKKLVKQ